MSKEKKILIIKTGRSETFNEHGPSSIASLGDVLRTTFLLNFFKEDKVYWLTDKNALPLLKDNHLIHSIYSEYDGLCFNEFDLIINLEKEAFFLELCVERHNLFGFYLSNDAELMFKAYASKKEYKYSELLDIFIKENIYLFQDKLCWALGLSWDKQPYILDFPTSLTSKFDIGINWKIGDKWPTKALPREFVDKLVKGLSKEFSVSMQEGFNDLNCYMNWISSCRLILTLDSLGLHIALAQRKKVVAIFGPTCSKEIYLYGQGAKIVPQLPTYYSCVPCYKATCHQVEPCTDFYSLSEIVNTVRLGII